VQREPVVAFSTAALNTFILLTATEAPATINKESIVVFSWQQWLSYSATKQRIAYIVYFVEF
jgi:hypothetical protein